MKTYSFQFQTKKGWINQPEPSVIDFENTLIIAFCSPMYKDKPEILEQLKAKYPKSIVIGCSTSGEIYGDQIFDLSVSCTALCFESSKLKLVSHKLEESGQSFEAGKTIANLLNSPDLRGVFILSDGLSANGSKLAEGVNSIIDTQRVSVSGGLAGDGNHFKHTWVYNNGKIQNQVVVAVGFYGKDLLISSASKGGWDIFGPERVITKSSDNILYEFDGRPALDLYKEYLGDKAKDLPASGLLFPIQIRTSIGVQKRLVRTILSVDEKTKSVIFAGNVPQGNLAQLMRANFDRVIDGASDAAETISKRLKAEVGQDVLNFPSACLAVSCVGRRLVLGARSDEEVEALSGSLGTKTAVLGFYSYGELAPAQQGAPCDLHNQSMTLMNIYELSSNQFRKTA